MSVREYIGARYVPLFADPTEWDSTRQYEPLTIVMHNGNSFTSKQFVPAGIDINNSQYWAETGNWNAQVEQYRQEVLRFEETTETFADRIDALEGFTADNVYCVGEGCEYTTIQSAYDAAVNSQGGTIVIFPGTYDEAITMAANSDSYDIKFVGLCREKCVWESSTFGYANACFTGSGNLTFANLTFVKGTSTSQSGGGYCLHMDYPNMHGDMYVDNCTLISYENAAIGCGTRTNQRIYIRNSTLISYSGGNTNYGGLLYHSSSDAYQSGQYFELVNCICMGLNSSGGPALSIWKSSVDTESFEIKLVGNIVMSTYYKDYGTHHYDATAWGNVVSFTKGTDHPFIITPLNCYGNNHDALNAIAEIGRGQKTKNYDDTPMLITDTTDTTVKNGYIRLTSGATTDVPRSGDYYGTVTSFNNYRMYIVQRMNSNYPEIYIKLYANGSVVTDWTKIGEAYARTGWMRTSFPLQARSANTVYLSYQSVKISQLSSFPLDATLHPTNNLHRCLGLYSANGTTFSPCIITISTGGAITCTDYNGQALTGDPYVSFTTTYLV